MKWNMEIMVSAWSSQIDCIAAFLWVDSEWIPQPSARGLYYVLTLDNAKYRIEQNVDEDTIKGGWPNKKL